MSAIVIDGKTIAASVRERVRLGVSQFVQENAHPPGLATILIGEDPASAVYVGGKQKACKEVGITGFDHRLAADTPDEKVCALIASLNADPQVSGIIVQLPVPEHLDGNELTALVDPGKDVDGLTALNAGRLMLGQAGLRPCTPAGVMELLAAENIDVAGTDAVVIGRSNLFGKPMAQLLLQANATVTSCHSRTQNLADVCRRADILVAAAGQAGLVRGDWVKPGATVIDVGIHRTETGLVGDVDFESACKNAAAITPVPGGVGPMTIACLLANTLKAAQRAQANR